MSLYDMPIKIKVWLLLQKKADMSNDGVRNLIVIKEA